MARRFTIIGILLFLTLVAIPVSAQTPTPSTGPVYIVQSGDTLWSIALRFNVSVTDLENANNLPDQNIFSGQELVIPGLAGISGTLTTSPVAYGETLHSLARQYGIDESLLRSLNHILSPDELYAGYNLTLLQQENKPTWTDRTSINKGETLLEAAASQNTDPWTIAGINSLAGTWDSLPGDILFLPGNNTANPATGFPMAFESVQVDPLPLIQGSTAQIKINVSQGTTLTGTLVDQPLHFFATADGSQVAFQGVYALTDPGVYPLSIDATLADGTRQSYAQMVPVSAGQFLSENLEVATETIDPAVTGPEDAWLRSMTAPANPDKYWQGMFRLPVDFQYCVRSRFGTRRSYNNGALFTFHSGLDFGVCSQAHPLDIYAPADGVVVFTGLKTVRGNVMIIDHGWGIYSGLFHQSEILVSVGDHVTAGQLVGKIGATGRVTGPHLHWDLWVNGIQVDPTVWLNEEFPH